MEDGFQFLEHTADVGIEIQAPTLDAVYEIAGQALFQLIAPQPPAGPGKKPDLPIQKKIESKGEEPEVLLVNFLNDLLYLFEVEGLLFRKVKIQTLEKGRLSAEAACERMASDGVVDTVVKAVTFHEARVERSGSKWRAVVYLDL